MTRRNVPGTTYLLHLEPPFKHARHYLGFAEGDGLEARLAEHGGPHGARILAAAAAAGSTWQLVRTWPDSTRAQERAIKNTRHVPHYCPECQPERSAARRALRATKSPSQGQRKGTDMTAQPDTRPDIDMSAAELGFKDAARITAALYSGGTPLEQIDAHHADTAARLFADAQTGPGRDYAGAYDDTARTLVADLQADAAAATTEPVPPGTPHPDPFLAERGWQTCEHDGHGAYYVRRDPATRAAIADREAA